MVIETQRTEQNRQQTHVEDKRWTHGLKQRDSQHIFHVNKIIKKKYIKQPKQ